jgi:hypothetical protein
MLAAALIELVRARAAAESPWPPGADRLAAHVQAAILRQMAWLAGNHGEGVA